MDAQKIISDCLVKDGDIWICYNPKRLEKAILSEHKKALAFELATNASVMEAETNYKLYEEQIAKRDKLILLYRQLITNLRLQSIGGVFTFKTPEDRVYFNQSNTVEEDRLNREIDKLTEEL